MEIRKATAEDLEQILCLFENTINSTCKDDYSEEQRLVWTSSVQNTKKWQRRINSQYFIIAELGNTIIGFCSLENNSYLDVLYVHQAFLRKDGNAFETSNSNLIESLSNYLKKLIDEKIVEVEQSITEAEL